jgi:hypothetical protein
MCILVAIFLGVLSGCFSAHDTIRDIRELKQDHSAYLDANANATPMMSWTEQRQYDQDYNIRHFSPWHSDRARSALPDIVAEFEKYGRKRGYGENGRRHDAGWIRKLRAEARLQDYPNAGYPAITVRPSSLRSLPTQKPHFNSYRQAVSGYPFDNLQATSVMVNTPVFVVHASRDKDWVWVETGYYFGWLPSLDVAPVSVDCMKRWETGHYAVVVKDKAPVIDEKGSFLFRMSLGAMHPLLQEDENGLKILVAVAGLDRQAVLKQIVLPKDTAAAKPVPMTNERMMRLANELINEPYGWGGLHGNRDCSAMIRDLFAPFGIWLPRNSGDQALHGGMFVDLSILSEEEKERTIATQGVPYLTLLWRKGHIMLYIGTLEGRPLVFHNFWGVSTMSVLGGRGKRIVGHAAITTLHPGREMFDYDKASADLTPNILGMTLIAKRPLKDASAK